MNVDRASAVTIIVGSALFLAAAFSPISWVYALPDAARQLEMITAAPNQWVLSHVMFGLGALLTVVGIGLLARRGAGQRSSSYLHASAALMTIGVLLWSWHLYLRAVDPAMFTAGEIPLWLFAGYSLLTMVGLALLGNALLQSGLAAWVGWLAIGAAAFFLVLAILLGDMPPFVYYLVTLTVGIMLYRTASAAAALGANPGGAPRSRPGRDPA